MYQGQRSHTCRWYWMHTVNVTTAAHKRYTEVTNNYSAKSMDSGYIDHKWNQQHTTCIVTAMDAKAFQWDRPS